MITRSLSSFPLRLLQSAWGVTLVALAPATAAAHPLSQGSLDVLVRPDAVSMRARVTVEEVTVTNAATSPDAAPGPWAASGAAPYEQHAAYLAAHLHVIADGVELPGGLVRTVPPDDPKPSPSDFANYELLYPLPPKAATPRRVELHSDVLADGKFAPGMKWEATYIVRIARAGGPPIEGLLLTSAHPVRFVSELPSGGKAAASQWDAGRGWQMFKDYFVHGVRHILTGYDHLLFISALVLGAAGLWDLVKVVTAFTLAHTLTLTLAALNVIHLPGRIVEPLIAGSIVFVAVENVIWPLRSRGWGRLGAAFFFGLFHGLGFAGSLLEAMQGMRGATVLLAIAAFSVGVEAGHQVVVLPLFAGLKLARHAHGDEAGRRRFALMTQRVGSLGISLAGMFYLVVALRLSLVVSGGP